MARIVIAAAASHGPGIQRPVELWREFGERDRRDRRFDYATLAAQAPPGIERQLDPAIQRRRQGAIRDALGEVSRRLADARPDLAVIISNAHVVQPGRPRPVLSIVRAASLPFVESTGVTFEDSETSGAEQTVAGHPALADHLVERLNRDGFDVGCLDGFSGDDRLDEAFAYCYRWMLGGVSVPTLPFYLSRDLPGQPYPARCIALGHALREAIAAFPADLRVAVIGSGGLSHQVVDEALDRQVVEALCSGAVDRLAGLDRARLNRSPGTPEILNWITVGAVMAPARMDLLTYEPCYRSAAGTGFGGAVATWPSTTHHQETL